MIIFQVLGWIAIGAACFKAIQTSVLDQKMQAYRVPGESALSYLLVPLRWHKRLYVPEGHHFVSAAWRATLLMYGFGLLGAFLLVIGSA